MGKILEFKYTSPCSQRIADRIVHNAPAVLKASSSAPAPKPPVETVGKRYSRLE